MKLSQWLEINKTTASAFAETIGRSTSTVTRLVRGETTPRSSTMGAINKVTDGAVQPNDFFEVAA